jgi:uncharacterized SAM-binding protein YcdF (DUF218 family)
VLGWAISVLGVLAWGRREASAPADAIVVLGAAQYAGRPSPVLRARLDHAYDLYKRRMAPTVILTGGQGDGDTISEAEVGVQYLRKRGVPARAMLAETEGRDTEQSIAAVAAMADTANLGSVILVSDPFHMFRLQLLSWRHGLRAACSPTRTSPIAASSEQTWSHILGESVKVPASLVLAVWRLWRT